ncbi:MAG: helix-turn-helix domain-containing protein [Halobacteriales archaeon]
MREAVVTLNDRGLDAIGLDGVMGVLREAGLRDVTELEPEGIQQIRVDEPIPGAELERLDAVDWWERIDESSAGATYLLKLDVPDCEEACPLGEHSAAYQVSDVGQRGIDLSIIGSQDEIGRSVEGMVSAGLDVDLERLTEYRGSGSTMDRLTDRQREVVRTAHSLGYYDVPRAASTEEVASELDLDPSTVAEHLQRAERNLMGDVLVSAE